MRFAIVVLLVLLPSFALAQQAYTPPNQALWEAMVKALQDVPMAMSAHQTVQQILLNVQAQAAQAAKQEKPDAK